MRSLKTIGKGNLNPERGYGNADTIQTYFLVTAVTSAPYFIRAVTVSRLLVRDWRAWWSAVRPRGSARFTSMSGRMARIISTREGELLAETIMSRVIWWP